MLTAEAISIFVTLFVIIDPIGTAPLFLALTAGMPSAERRAVALRSVLVAAGVLVAFALLGEQVLAFIGISMPAFRIAGGILLFLTALEMLFERRNKRRSDKAEEVQRPDPSVFPLAIPLVAGPGAIATVILLVGEAGGSATGVAQVIGIAVGVLGIVYLLFRLAGAVEGVLGQTGIDVLTRLFGMLLAALSVQFVLDGLSAYGLGAQGMHALGIGASL